MPSLVIWCTLSSLLPIALYFSLAIHVGSNTLGEPLNWSFFEVHIDDITSANLASLLVTPGDRVVRAWLLVSIVIVLERLRLNNW